MKLKFRPSVKKKVKCTPEGNEELEKLRRQRGDKKFHGKKSANQTSSTFRRAVDTCRMGFYVIQIQEVLFVMDAVLFPALQRSERMHGSWIGNRTGYHSILLN